MTFAEYRALRLHEMLHERWGNERCPGLLELIAHCNPRDVLEIGSYEGVSTELFLLHCSIVTAIDPWPDWMSDVEQAFIRRCSRYPGLIRIKGHSPHDIPTKQRIFDLVYIDGDHSFDAVCQDIGAARLVVREDGWIGGHDYDGPATPDVRRACDHMGITAPITFPDSNWLIRYGA